ncbi:uncharacterized protein LOC110437515 [Sorghum bicolor]|uniref:uncharacterized protein LOC110437515 n=1 Tax=Sorghum bicolor TaxID=4558 RepID=UPI000B4251D8|nr:uncharacterized protein LOC110437515 [Sorghum bicolor]|eukprot:XP_021321661.1 uncharacterized protein LOC110437515 [Sorghum bicolor]
MRMLTYGLPTDAIDEYIRIGESTALESLRKFVAAVVDIFEDEYLRYPNEKDTTRLLALGEKKGFLGMLGCIDCMHWTWKNCKQECTTPQVNYTVNGHEYTMGYYLANGIYPSWATLVKTINRPAGNKEKYFAKAQEAARKAVERAFGVLQASQSVIF